MTKPFRFEELLARIRVRLRPDASAPKTEITVGELRLDLHARTVTVLLAAIAENARAGPICHQHLHQHGEPASAAMSPPGKRSTAEPGPGARLQLAHVRVRTNSPPRPRSVAARPPESR